MKHEEQLALASYYGTWETGRLIDAITNHSAEYAPQGLVFMAKEIERRGVTDPGVESFINSKSFLALAGGLCELATKEERGVEGQNTDTPNYKRLSIVKPRWFLIPLPATLVTLLVIGVLQMFDKSTGGPNGLKVFILLCGGAFFPVGLFDLFASVLPRGAFAYPGLVILACLGYALYLAVIIWGYCRPSPKLFFVLCALLLLNIAGCHLSGKGF